MPTTAFDNAMILRPAVSDDESQIIALMPYLADFAIPTRRQPEHLWSGDAEMARAILAGQTDSSFIDVAADDNGKIAGLIMVSMREEMLSHDPSAHLEAIVVDPRARGCGLGKRLMQHCEARVRELGASSLTLHVFQSNERARALYAGEDFDEELIRAIKWLD